LQMRSKRYIRSKRSDQRSAHYCSCSRRYLVWLVLFAALLVIVFSYRYLDLLFVALRHMTKRSANSVESPFPSADKKSIVGMEGYASDGEVSKRLISKVTSKDYLNLTDFVSTVAGDTKISSNHTLLVEVMRILQAHPLARLQRDQRRTMSLEDQLLYMQGQPECKQVPIFTSMANVFSDLYWQL